MHARTVSRTKEWWDAVLVKANHKISRAACAEAIANEYGFSKAYCLVKVTDYRQHMVTYEMPTMWERTFPSEPTIEELERKKQEIEAQINARLKDGSVIRDIIDTLIRNNITLGRLVREYHIAYPDTRSA